MLQAQTNLYTLSFLHLQTLHQTEEREKMIIFENNFDTKGNFFKKQLSNVIYNKFRFNAIFKDKKIKSD